jgi:uroporphyrinogen-III synthase
VRDGELEIVAGAERTWAPAAGAAIPVPAVAWVRGRAPAADRHALAARLAARIVTLRQRPRVLTARPAGQAVALLDALAAAGVDAVNVPAIEIRMAEAGGPLDDAVAAVGNGGWVVVASANAARAALAAFERTGSHAATTLWAAVGEATAEVLAASGVSVSFVASAATGEALAAELPVAAGDRVLVPRADIAGPGLAAALRDRGAIATDTVAYHTEEGPLESRELLAAALDDGPVDALVLTSGSTARGILALAEDETVRERLRLTPVIAIGVPTADTARAEGFATVIVVPSPAAPALAAFVAESLGVQPGATPGGDR